MKVAEIVVNLPLDKTFYYYIPENLNVFKNQRVVVDFAGRKMMGFVLKTFEMESFSDIASRIKTKEIKPVLKTLDREAIVDDRTVRLAYWMSKYNFCSLGESLFTIIPSAVKEKSFSHEYKYLKDFKRLTPEQQVAFNQIKNSIVENRSDVFLLHGVTGSGKTEIYKYLVRTALENNKSAIILVPEIALTPQNLERFYSSFGDEVSLYHSKMSPSERLYQWKRVFYGKSHIIIGPRSAIFLPLQKLGLIIIDEESEPSYKSNNTPRYHARDVALYRGKTENAVVVLGSATPQIETYFYAKKKKFILVELKKRYSVKLPEVSIVDMRNEEKEGYNVISSELMQQIVNTLSKGKQVLLFLNRRGFSPVLICKDCGFVFECPACNISLTFHKIESELKCHHCGYKISLPSVCPRCNGVRFQEIGSGTEKIEILLNTLLPGYRVERMDLDTTRRKNSYFEILRKIKNHEVDIVVGTQMIAKGHDIEGIELVGVIMPDIMLNLPDFRAPERTFTLLTQVIGRAGRKDQPGKALIQTFSPEHYAISFAKDQNYEGFFREEIKRRKEFNYPPFVGLGRIVIRSKNKKKLDEFLALLRDFIPEIKSKTNCEILGPVSCPLEKLKNNYRYHIIIKSLERKSIAMVVDAIKNFFKDSSYVNYVYIEIDIDPLSLL